MQKKAVSNKVAAYNGALVAVAGTFVYALVVMLYSIIRSSISICSMMPAADRSTILWANAFSMAYSVAVFSLLMAIISSFAGALAGVVLRKTMLRFNPQLQFSRAIIISSITALALLSLFYFLLYLLLRERITFRFAETLLFWYIFPAVIFLVAVIPGGVKLNNHSKAI